MRSFINPRKKKILDDMSSLWLMFIAFISLGLIGFGIYINYKSSFYIKMLEENSQRNTRLGNQVHALESDNQIIKMQRELYHEVQSTNVTLKESIKNLFDLVPDQITLTDVLMEKDSLILKGYCASKEAYTLLLEPPLKSIFDDSRVSFTTNNRGFYEFVSKNSILSGQEQLNDER